MERGMFFTYVGRQREGLSEFYQDCVLTVDIGRVPAGTEVQSIQVFCGNSMILVVDGERIRFQVEFVEQIRRPVSMGVVA